MGIMDSSSKPSKETPEGTEFIPLQDGLATGFSRSSKKLKIPLDKFLPYARLAPVDKCVRALPARTFSFCTFASLALRWHKRLPVPATLPAGRHPKRLGSSEDQGVSDLRRLPGRRLGRLALSILPRAKCAPLAHLRAPRSHHAHLSERDSAAYALLGRRRLQLQQRSVSRRRYRRDAVCACQLHRTARRRHVGPLANDFRLEPDGREYRPASCDVRC